jgi:hypothetical protein
MAPTAAAPVPAVHARAGTAATSQASWPSDQRSTSPRLVRRRHGAVSFLVPFVVADQIELQRDGYYAVYVPAVVGFFVAWARDTRQPLREMFARRWRLAVVLGVAFAAISAFIAVRAEGGTTHPGGIEFIAALGWRGIVYGAADGLLLSAFPILLVFAALRDSRLRRRAGGLLAVGAVAILASLAMTAVTTPATATSAPPSCASR